MVPAPVSAYRKAAHHTLPDSAKIPDPKPLPPPHHTDPGRYLLRILLSQKSPEISDTVSVPFQPELPPTPFQRKRRRLPFSYLPPQNPAENSCRNDNTPRTYDSMSGPIPQQKCHSMYSASDIHDSGNIPNLMYNDLLQIS